MLATLEDEKKADWKSYLAPLVQAYNATKSSATGYSPHYLMFGWHPRLSVDAFFGTDPGEQGAKDHSSYVSKLRSRMEFAYKTAQAEASKKASQNKNRYDRSIREARLEVGDRVLTRKVGLKGKHKLADRWNREPYLVCTIPNSDIPVYEVKLETGRGPLRTLHRNMLLPFNTIPVEDSPKLRNRKGSSKKPVSPPHVLPESVSPSSSSETDSEDDIAITLRRRRQRRGNNPAPPQNSHDPVDITITDSVNTTIGESEEIPIITESEFNRLPNIMELSAPDSDLSDRNHTETTVSTETTVTTETSPEPQQPRRSGRNRKPPDRFGSWVQPLQARSRDEVFV